MRWSQVDGILQGIDKSVLSHKLATLEYARLKKVVKFVDSVLQGIDPEMTNIAVLTNANGSLESFINNITYFIASKDISALRNANQDLSVILNYIGQLVSVPSGNVKKNLTSAANAYSQVIEEQIDQHKILYQKLERELLELQTEISNQKNVSESTQNQYNDRYAEATNKLDEFLQGLDQKYRATEEKRSENFIQELTGYSNNASKYLDEMKTTKKDAAKILGALIEVTHAGSYKRQADEDKISANQWRIISVCLMVLASILLAVPLILVFFGVTGLFDFTWKEMLNRVTVSSALFVTAIYCSRESSKHRQNERRNRRRELTLVSVGPFLALLADNDEKEAIKLKIANHLFIEDSVPIDQDEA